MSTPPPPPSGSTLSEGASKALLAEFGIPVAAEHVVDTASDAADAADRIGYPVVVKLNGEAIAHKTERGLVRLRLGDRGAVEQAGRAFDARRDQLSGGGLVTAGSLVRILTTQFISWRPSGSFGAIG
jgi:acyl-CoA synthetase (NDP forming)